MSEITLVDYLIEQLEKLGINDFFGLPGDFNFNIVEAIEKNNNTNWIGCTNELNAGYAADGYARTKGYGAIVTTYGVGELSAINAVAGSFAEYVPVIKIAGVPSTKNIANNDVLHHNFAEPNYYAFKNAYSNVTQTTAYLTRENAKEEIDRVISDLINYKKPVYLAIPDDICEMKIKNEPNIIKLKSDEKNLSKALNHIMDLLKKAKKPTVIADILCERFEAKKELIDFLNQTNYPSATLLMGKSLLDENVKSYMGIYLGKNWNKKIYNYVNNSDCIISIGTIYSDLNTFGFDFNYNPSSMIEIKGTYCVVENIQYKNVLMKDILIELSKIAPVFDSTYPRETNPLEITIEENKELKSDYIYSKLQNFIKEDDIVFSETGIVEFGFAPMKLPKNVKLNNQVLWGSIGWATPACFGASIARKDKRVILITGEGSHQLTAQEVSSMMRYNVKPIIIVINNSGYTIERVLCKNPMDEFNNISSWNYSKLTEVFNGEACSYRAETNKDFDRALEQAQTEQRNKLCYIEAIVDKMDLPQFAKITFGNKLSNVPLNA